MKILLVNTNQVVQKLVEMTTRKIEAQLTTLASLQDLSSHNKEESDLIILDDGVLSALSEKAIALLPKDKMLLLQSSDNQLDAFFSLVIKKPFLPNELLNLFLSLRNQSKNQPKQEETQENDEEFDQLLKDLNITENKHNDQEIREEKLENLDPLQEQVREEKQEDPITHQIVQELENSEQEELEDEGGAELKDVQGGVLDLQEISMIKELLDENKNNKPQVQSNDLALLTHLLQSKNPESLREVLDGMQLTINISFPKKDNS